jgi:hypothetical protein
LKRDRQTDKYLNDFVRKNSFRFVFFYILYTYCLDLLALNMDNSLDIVEEHPQIMPFFAGSLNPNEIRISHKNFGTYDRIQTLPLYAAGNVLRTDYFKG